MQIDNGGWLVEDASGLPPLSKIPSVRSTTLDGGKPAGVVWHWTGGVCRGDGVPRVLANEIRTFDRAKDRAASWHVCIGKDGQIVQSIGFTLGSWHVGRPGRIGGPPTKTPLGAWDATTWQGGPLSANINRVTAGVELANSGRLEKVDDKFYCWPFWLDPDRPGEPDPKLEIASERAVLHDGKWWDEFPLAQEQAATRLLQALVVKYKWNRYVCQYGHVMFDPARKEDPGPVWLDVVLPRILDTIFGPE